MSIMKSASIISPIDIKALLYTQGLEPKNHEGLEHLFGLHFVKPGKADAFLQGMQDYLKI